MEKFYGLIGEKLGHSLSPIIHGFILEEVGLSSEARVNYNLFQVKASDLEKAIRGLLALGCGGANVTIPYKVKAMEYLHYVCPKASKIGAVNTLCFKDNKISGYNTDYYGFAMSLNKNNISVSGRKALVLGSGGSAKMVVQYLLDEDAEQIYLATRDVEKIKKCKWLQQVEVISYEEVQKLKGYIIINCTPCGMHPKVEDSPLELSDIENFQVVYDLIYNPDKTKLLSCAAELGLQTVNGLYMLVAQAVKAQELWQERNIDEIVIHKVHSKIETLLRDMR